MMFWSRRCPSCGKKVKDDWNYCPYCGASLREEDEKDFFGQIEREFDRIFKSFGFGGIKIKPFGRGVEITISSKPVRKQTYAAKPRVVQQQRKPPKVVEEPETKVEFENGTKVIKIEIPGVEKNEDVDIKTLPNSIEVKAYTGEKAYFKVIPLPPNYKLISRKFEPGRLVLYVTP